MAISELLLVQDAPLGLRRRLPVPGGPEGAALDPGRPAAFGQQPQWPPGPMAMQSLHSRLPIPDELPQLGSQLQGGGGRRPGPAASAVVGGRRQWPSQGERGSWPLAVCGDGTVEATLIAHMSPDKDGLILCAPKLAMTC